MISGLQLRMRIRDQEKLGSLHLCVSCFCPLISFFLRFTALLCGVEILKIAN
jgi:hypothetical protein